jgi:hypothetical protein
MSLCWSIISIFLYILKYKGYLPNYSFINTLFNEQNTALRIVIPISTDLILLDNPLMLGFCKFIIFVVIVYIFSKKIDVKSAALIFVIIMSTTFYGYINIVCCLVYLPLYVLGCGSFISIFEESFRDTVMRMNASGAQNDNSMIPPATPALGTAAGTAPAPAPVPGTTVPAAGTNTTYNPEIHNKTPYAFHTAEDVAIANEALRYIGGLSKPEIVSILEQVKPVLRTHKTGANIDLTYVQQAALKSIMAGADFSKVQHSPHGTGKTYGGTIEYGAYSFKTSLYGNQYDIRLTGPTGTKSTFYGHFNDRFDRFKLDSFILHRPV